MSGAGTPPLPVNNWVLFVDDWTNVIRQFFVIRREPETIVTTAV